MPTWWHPQLDVDRRPGRGAPAPHPARGPPRARSPQRIAEQCAAWAAHARQISRLGARATKLPERFVDRKRQGRRLFAQGLTSQEPAGF